MSPAVAAEERGVGARRNACEFEFFPIAGIAHAAGIALPPNKMEFAAATAYDSVPHWHAVIMLRPQGQAFLSCRKISITLIDSSEGVFGHIYNSHIRSVHQTRNIARMGSGSRNL